MIAVIERRKNIGQNKRGIGEKKKKNFSTDYEIFLGKKIKVRKIRNRGKERERDSVPNLTQNCAYSILVIFVYNFFIFELIDLIPVLFNVIYLQFEKPKGILEKN